MINLEGKCYCDGVMTGLGSPSLPCKWGLALANPNPGLACQGLPCLTLTLTQVLAVFSCRGPRKVTTQTYFEALLNKFKFWLGLEFAELCAEICSLVF